MMTPMHTDLIKYSTPAAPTAYERQAMHTRCRTRRAVFRAFIEKVFSRTPRTPEIVAQPRYPQVKVWNPVHPNLIFSQQSSLICPHARGYQNRPKNVYSLR